MPEFRLHKPEQRSLIWIFGGSGSLTRQRLASLDPAIAGCAVAEEALGRATKKPKIRDAFL